MAEAQSTQVAVIGAGPAGYAAAFRAADLGLAVTIVDDEANPGGVCLYRGCIPSKALLHVARMINEAAAGAHCGVSFGPPKIDLDKLRAFKDGVVSQLTGGTGQLRKARGIKHLRGRAAFADAHRLVVTDAAGKQQELLAESVIVATGSQPIAIPGVSIADPRVLDSTTALELPAIPKRLLIVGGGYIGLELGSVYASLGSEVSVVEMTDGLLPGADRDLVKVLQTQLKARFSEFMFKTKVTGVEAQKSGLKVSLEGANVEPSQHYDMVLVAVGRRPTTGDLGLDKAGVRLSERGFIEVDPQRRSSVPHILAVGDVAGEPMLAHKGSHEGIIAAEVIAGERVAYEPAAIPGVVFTDPELAWCGLSETLAKARGIDVNIVKFPWAASGRAVSIDRTDGLTKLVIDPESERILGVGIVGVGAGEMIAEGTLAVEMAALASDLKLTIHAHPTLSETVMEAAELVHGSSTHIYRPKRK